MPAEKSDGRFRRSRKGSRRRSRRERRRRSKTGWRRRVEVEEEEEKEEGEVAPGKQPINEGANFVLVVSRTVVGMVLYTLKVFHYMAENKIVGAICQWYGMIKGRPMYDTLDSL